MVVGKVIFVSGNGAMIVVQHDDGYALVEMLGDEGALAVGDKCSGDWDALGGETITSGGAGYEVYMQGSWADRNTAVEMATNAGGAPRS